MSGSLWLKAESAGLDTLPAVPRPRPRWAAADPIDELTTRLEDVIAAAVHPDEIAAILESDGMTDDHIRLTYGREDSFALAEDLYARVERRFTEPEGPPTDLWHTGLGGCLLRGLVFALPGLAYVLGAPLLAGPPGPLGLPAGTVPLLAGAVTGWVWNQALSHRAYSWLGLGDRRAAARTLLRGAPAGALLGALVAVAAAGPGEWGGAVFAAGQAVYLGAATVLLVLDRERALLGALAPLIAGTPAAHWVGLPDPVRAALLGTSLAVAVVLAWRELRPGRSHAGERGRAEPRLAASVPYGLFGLGTGGLVLYAAIGDVLAEGAGASAAGAPVAGASVVGPTAVALTLSMGPAEWLLHRFRSESRAGLRAATSSRAFRRATATTLALCLTVYLAVLLALAVTGTLLWPGAPDIGGIRLASLLLIGTVLWAALLLQSFGAVLSAALVCGAATGAQTVALVTGAGDPRLVGAGVAGAAAVVLAVLGCVLLGRATAHRT
ncbi:hypothetical protein AMK26_04415 [Streptomyces sp. CB03234]|uniref:hypothetical protein n=1 Tax=Streptomyces sp. (strain CB03234) TaxID=1703937 RepID=UPI00093B181F|nr:hypothetical protein [Streptomyces sp. CB03234]OKK08266.1 hypothetical protein AMK26_04415 [Streptomyces sp. CB03234]